MCTARCTWRACAGGSTCDAPRDAPSSVQAQPQPASLGCVSRPQVCRRAGSGAGPLRLCARALVFARAEVPPSQGNLEVIGASGRAKGSSTNEASPRAGRAWTEAQAGADGEPSPR